MNIRLTLAAAALAAMTLVPAVSLASTPEEHNRGPVVHDRTPHVPTQTQQHPHGR